MQASKNDGEETIDDLDRRLVQKQYAAQAAENSADPAQYHPESGAWTLTAPTTSDGWARLCQARWEDCRDIATKDPFIKAREKPASEAWQAFYHEQDANDAALLSSKSSYMVIQRHVRRLADGQKAQDFQELWAVGCTKKYAVVVATVVASPEFFHVFVLPIDRPDPPKTEMVRRDPLPADRLNNYDTEKKLNETMQEASIENVEPAWDVVPNSQMRGAPLISALDQVSGKIALVCYGGDQRVHVFDLGRELEFARCQPIDLLTVPPDIVAISSECVAVGYFHTVGRVSEDRTEPLPPNVRVHRFAQRPQDWKTVLPIKPKDDTKPGVREFYEISCLEFHRSHPDVLIIGTTDGGILSYECSQAGDHHPELNEKGLIFYPGPGLMELYASYRQQATVKSGDEAATEDAMRRMPEPARQPIWFVRWNEYRSALEDQPFETRMLVGMNNSIVVLNASASNIEAKARERIENLGKKPMAFIPRETPALSMESLGGLLVIHDAAENELIFADLAAIRPRWKFSHPDVVGKIKGYNRPYPSLVLFSRRIVVLWPNGFVGFVEIASEEMQKKYEEEHQRLLAEMLAEMQLKEKNKTEGK